MYSRDKIIETMRDIYKESAVIKPYVVIAQPRRNEETDPGQKLNGYDGIHLDLTGYSHGFCSIIGEKVDVARNYLIEEVLESGAKYLFFVGDDTILPFNAFKRLHETAEKNPGSVVTGVYYMKAGDPMIMVRDGNWIKVANVDPGQLIEACQTGMDCMLIPLEVLKRMKAEEPELPFCCIGHKVEDLPFIGEDNFFVYRLHKMNVKLLVDTDVQCLHMDLKTGKYTAHPSVDLDYYFTNITPTTRLTLKDKRYLDERWQNTVPKGSFRESNGE